MYFLEINYNYNDRVDQTSRIPYIPINIPDPFPYAFDQTKNTTSNGLHNMDRNDSISRRERRELDNGGLDAVGVDYMKPTNFQRPATPKIQEVKKVPSFHVTYWMFYPYSQVTERFSYPL